MIDVNIFLALSCALILALAGQTYGEPIDSPEISLARAERELDYDEVAMVYDLGGNLKEVCGDDVDYHKVAVNLGDDSSDEFRCMAREFAEGSGESLMQMLQDADEEFKLNYDNLKFYNKIRDPAEGQKTIENLLAKAMVACRSYIVSVAPFFVKFVKTEADEKLDRALMALNACKLLVKNGLGPMAKTNISKRADQMFNHISKLQG